MVKLPGALILGFLVFVAVLGVLTIFSIEHISSMSFAVRFTLAWLGGCLAAFFVLISS